MLFSISSAAKDNKIKAGSWWKGKDKINKEHEARKREINQCLEVPV